MSSKNWVFFVSARGQPDSSISHWMRLLTPTCLVGITSVLRTPAMTQFHVEFSHCVTMPDHTTIRNAATISMAGPYLHHCIDPNPPDLSEPELSSESENNGDY